MASGYWPIRVNPGAPRRAFAPGLSVAQHFDETEFDDDARGSPGKSLLANERGVRGSLASRLRVEGDEPVETVEEIWQVHWGRSEAAPIRTGFARRRHGVQQVKFENRIKARWCEAARFTCAVLNSALVSVYTIRTLPTART